MIDGMDPYAARLADDERGRLAELAGWVPTVLVSDWPWATAAGTAGLGLAAVVPIPFEIGDLCAAVRSAAARSADWAGRMRARREQSRRLLERSEHLAARAEELLDRTLLKVDGCLPGEPPR